RRAPQSTHPAGCPEFGDDSVLTRPPKAPAKTKSVAPGSHRAQRGEHEIVWWDPRLLILNVEEKMGLRQDKLLQADESRQVSDRGVRLHDEWSASRAAMLASGMTPRMNVATATELALAAPADGPPSADTIAIEETRRDRGRPHGKRFGTLVHLTMLRVPFDADAREIGRIAASAARMIGAPDDEVAAAADAVKAALKSPLMGRARAANTIMRECPLIVRLEDGTAVEGVADLAFAENTADGLVWTVVDFKTDVEVAPRLDEYRAQIRFYVRAVRESTGRPAGGAILWI
ncbi:MAG TPA: PD-(D/E)XK nuclease family protein, partial [Candidatus Binatus sp.]|nr:PD-(D/E)XK nuclease family protein [Candidatus Binatus sp.]